jgi:hypothetical protein
VIPESEGQKPPELLRFLHSRNLGQGANASQYLFKLGTAFWLLNRITANKKKREKENEKLAFYGTNFPPFQILLLCNPPPPKVIGQVTLMVYCVAATEGERRRFLIRREYKAVSE